MERQTLRVGNCPNCGKVYQLHPLRSICDACSRAGYDLFRSCEAYLLHHSKTTMEELCGQTGIPERTVRTWILEGKLSLHLHPNLTYCCDLCARHIRKGRLCTDCSGRINHDIRKLMERESAIRKPVYQRRG